MDFENIPDFAAFDDEDDDDMGIPQSIHDMPLDIPPRPAAKSPYPYTSLESSDFLFLETFDRENIFDKWISTQNSRFSGQWTQAVRHIEGIEGDKGLRTMNEARHHAIFRKLPSRISSSEGLSFSYEVKFEETLQCGGAYVKLFDSSLMQESQFLDSDPYVVMFGPDKCGSTNKVHLILKKQNPLSGEWMEHHLVEPPRVPSSPETHHFGFSFRPDDTFAIYVDGKEVATGQMNEHFDPPFTPAKMVVDEEDVKPSDWVDDEMIEDPEAEKPEDWDDDAPRLVPDPAAEQPEGWREDLPALVPDWTATEPEDWNEEEDGQWEAPFISNPECEHLPGCGKWSPKLISNPNYRGLWKAPFINNPEFKGAWKPRMIPNPTYFEDDHPHHLAEVDAVGFEIWTMQAGLFFDNIVFANAYAPIANLVKNSWTRRFEVEASIYSTNGRTDASTESSGYLKNFIGGIFEDKETLIGAIVILLVNVALFRYLGVFRYFQREKPEGPKPTEGTKPEKSSEENKETPDPAAAPDTTSESPKKKASDSETEIVEHSETEIVEHKGKGRKRK